MRGRQAARILLGLSGKFDVNAGLPCRLSGAADLIAHLIAYLIAHVSHPAGT